MGSRGGAALGAALARTSPSASSTEAVAGPIVAVVSSGDLARSDNTCKFAQVDMTEEGPGR